MRAVLELIAGPAETRTLLMRPGEILQFGRTEWADVSLPEDGHLSSVHFALHCEEGGCRIRDLNSTNGTRVNGHRISEIVLNSGDLIQAGNTQVRVTIEGPHEGPTIAPRHDDRTAVIAASEIFGDDEPADSSPESDGASSLAPQASASVLDEDVVGEATLDNQRPPTAVSEPEQPAEPAVRPIRETIVRAATPAPPPVDEFVAFTSSVVPPAFQAAIATPGSLRQHALIAAAALRQPWVLEYCRVAARRPAVDRWEALSLLAVLGRASDVDLVRRCAANAELGSRRFDLLASLGNPQAIDDLIEAMKCDDPRTSVAAGAAFVRVSGTDIWSDRRVELEPEEDPAADEFDREFLDEAFLPDVGRAQECWRTLGRDLAQATRVGGGMDISGESWTAVADQLDLKSRWEAMLRATYEGDDRWQYHLWSAVA